MFANPKLANTAQSQTTCKLTLQEIKKKNSIFENIHFQGISDPYDDIPKKFRLFSENPKVTNTGRSQTLRRLTLHGVDN